MSEPYDSPRSPKVSGFLLLLALLVLVLGTPILKTYLGALRGALGMSSILAFAAAMAAGFFLLFVLAWKWPRALAVALGCFSVLLVVRSGNALPFLWAAVLLGITLIAGDAVARLLRGFEARAGEQSISLAAGGVAVGICLLLLGEAGLVKSPLPALAAALLLWIRRRRIPELARRIADAPRALLSGRLSRIDALWIAVVVAFLFPGFLGALRPDLSWDALAYHLPQIRDFAEKGRVLPLPNLYPATYLWRNYDTYLGLSFLAGGERVVRFVHLGMGLAAFAATSVLARRLGSRVRCPLAVLALCAVPAASLQLRNTFVDLPAALFLAAAAAEVAASREEPRRVWLGGFLFGGAVATKIFAVLAAPALALLLVRRHRGSSSRLFVFALFAAIVLVPWLALSQSRLGFFLAPYYDPLRAQRSDPRAAIYGPPIDPEGPPSPPRLDVVRFLRLPYDLTFDPTYFSRFGEYTGLLAFLLLPGLAGWGRRRLWLLGAAGLAVAAPLYVASSLHWIVFTARYFVPIYPLYAAAAGLGWERLTEGFRGRLGGAAAVSIAAVALAVSIPLVFAPGDLRNAVGHVPAERVLSALPSYPLWTHVRPEDRVLLLGDPDRYHCPARVIVSDTLVFPTERVDPNRWKTEWGPMGVNVILHRSDRRDAAAFLRSLGGCLHPVAANGVATLYRVDRDREDCAPAGGN